MAPRSIDCSGVLLQLGNITVFITGKGDIDAGLQDEELGKLSGQGYGATGGGESGLLETPTVISLAFRNALGDDRDGVSVVAEGSIDPDLGNYFTRIVVSICVSVCSVRGPILRIIQNRLPNHCNTIFKCFYIIIHYIDFVGFRCAQGTTREKVRINNIIMSKTFFIPIHHFRPEIHREYRNRFFFQPQSWCSL